MKNPFIKFTFSTMIEISDTTQLPVPQNSVLNQEILVILKGRYCTGISKLHSKGSI